MLRTLFDVEKCHPLIDRLGSFVDLSSPILGKLLFANVTSCSKSSNLEQFTCSPSSRALLEQRLYDIRTSTRKDQVSELVDQNG